MNLIPQDLMTHTPLLFIDTDMYVMKVWCEFVFGKCHRFILDEIVERKYDLYLIMQYDLPWVKMNCVKSPTWTSRQKLIICTRI